MRVDVPNLTFSVLSLTLPRYFVVSSQAISLPSYPRPHLRDLSQSCPQAGHRTGRSFHLGLSGQCMQRQASIYKFFYSKYRRSLLEASCCVRSRSYLPNCGKMEAYNCRRSSGDSNQSQYLSINCERSFEANTFPTRQERKCFHRIILEGLLIKKLSRSNNKPEIPMLRKLVLKGPVDPFPEAPIYQLWKLLAGISVRSSELKHELAEHGRRDCRNKSEELFEGKVGHITEHHVKSKSAEDCILCQAEVRELGISCRRKISQSSRQSR